MQTQKLGHILDQFFCIFDHINKFARQVKKEMQKENASH